MIRLTRALHAWGTPAFEAILKQEIEGLDTGLLPLQQGLGSSSYATDAKPQVMLIHAAETRGLIRIRAGIFYSGIIAGCSCADDPTPVGEQNEYCVLQVDIDRVTGAATIVLVEDA